MEFEWNSTSIFRCLTGDPALFSPFPNLPFPFESVVSEFTILALIVPPGIAILAAAVALSALLPVVAPSA